MDSQIFSAISFPLLAYWREIVIIAIAQLSLLQTYGFGRPSCKGRGATIGSWTLFVPACDVHVSKTGFADFTIAYSTAEFNTRKLFNYPVSFYASIT
jgi:hypothetical protein